jgi:hypothetical protein
VEDMHALGRKPTARVMGNDIVTADMTVAGQLALDQGRAGRQNPSRAPGGWCSPLLR